MDGSYYKRYSEENGDFYTSTINFLSSPCARGSYALFIMMQTENLKLLLDQNLALLEKGRIEEMKDYSDAIKTEKENLLSSIESIVR